MQINLETKYCPKGIYQITSPGVYRDGSPALKCLDQVGHPQFTATVCIEGQRPKPGHVFIKDWSENEGVLDALLEAGIVEEPIRNVTCGFSVAHECKLTPLGIRVANND